MIISVTPNKIGATPTFVLVVTEQLLVALILNHFHLMNLAHNPLIFKKVLCFALIVIGASLAILK